MHKPQKQVSQFHYRINAPGMWDGYVDPKLPDRFELRASLIAEEAAETINALTGEPVEVIVGRPAMPKFAIKVDELTKPDLIETIDGMCDLLVVTYGTAEEMYVDLEPHFDEVHRANMDKLGGPVREDGKQLKPKGWKAPDHKKILSEGR
jgi:predicted HAD superfamily Cof-like phosphohydrolase